MPTNAYPADGPRIKALRLRQGWTAAKLAELAGCSKRTVESMEASGNAHITSAAKLANALGASPADLLKGYIPPDPIPSDGLRSDFHFLSEKDFQDLDETQQLLEFLAGLQKRFNRPVFLVAVAPYNSTLITLNIHVDDWPWLTYLSDFGFFAHYDITQYSASSLSSPHWHSTQPSTNLGHIIPQAYQWLQTAERSTNQPETKEIVATLSYILRALEALSEAQKSSSAPKDSPAKSSPDPSPHHQKGSA